MSARRFIKSIFHVFCHFVLSSLGFRVIVLAGEEEKEGFQGIARRLKVDLSWSIRA